MKAVECPYCDGPTKRNGRISSGAQRWSESRGCGQAQKVVDLAVKADIEDMMLCDLPGVLSFLGLPPETEMPPGNKGKTKLKKLYRKVAPNKAYHSGERAEGLISYLDMAKIRASAPVPLEEIDRAVTSG